MGFSPRNSKRLAELLAGVASVAIVGASATPILRGASEAGRASQAASQATGSCETGSLVEPLPSVSPFPARQAATTTPVPQPQEQQSPLPAAEPQPVPVTNAPEAVMATDQGAGTAPAGDEGAAVAQPEVAATEERAEAPEEFVGEVFYPPEVIEWPEATEEQQEGDGTAWDQPAESPQPETEAAPPEEPSGPQVFTLRTEACGGQDLVDAGYLVEFVHRWWAAHWYTEWGQQIQAMRPGDIVHIDDITIQIAGSVNVPHSGATVQGVRADLPTEYLFQTCYGEGCDYMLIQYGYPV